MEKLKKYYPFFLASFLAFLAAEVVHYVFWGRFFFFLINSLILSLYCVYWPFSGLNSPENKGFQKCRIAISGVMIFWYFCKCAKDRFFMETDALARLSWYAYYVAIILLPLFCYEFSLQFDRSDFEQYRKRVIAFRITAGILIAGILTNDLHRLAFSFPEGIGLWDENYSHGPLYFAAAAYGLTMFIAALMHIFRRCTLPNSKKYIGLPIAPLAAGILHVVLYFFNLDLYINGIRIFSLTDVFCFLIMVFIDACQVVYQLATELPDEEAFLLHRILDEIGEQMDKAEQCLDSCTDEEEEPYRSNLFRAGFYQTYAKRVSNLLLLGEQGKPDFTELVLSLAESVEYLKLKGVEAMLVSEGEKQYPVSELLTVYREFERRLEPVLLNLGAVLVAVKEEKDGISLRISAEDREGNAL